MQKTDNANVAKNGSGASAPLPKRKNVTIANKTRFPFTKILLQDTPDSRYWAVEGDSYSESYTYDTGDGSLESMTTAGGQTLSYTYDALKRHTATTVAKNGSTIFRVAKSYYNHATESTRTTAQVQYYNVRNSAGTLIAGSQYVYDKLGNIIQIKESESPYRVLVAYEYDSLNQLTKETTYTYSGTSTTASSTTVNTFTYDTAGNLLKVFENGVEKDEYTYADNDWQDLLTKFNGTAISYDASGNPLNWYNGNTYTGLTWTMGRQLESMTVETDSEVLDISYSYDMSGMRSSKTVVAETSDSGNEGGSTNPEVPDCTHNWVEVGRTQYIITYQCTICNATYEEPIQQPEEMSLRSSSPTEYHEYIYASGKLMRETITTTDAEGDVTTEVLDFIYGSGSTPLALVYTNGTASPVTYYYVTNIQGDVVKMLSAGGTTVASYTYDAWGRVVSATGSMAETNPIRYRGYYYDVETELYYLQSRYYDPVVRRFVNADALMYAGIGFLGYNMYSYCGNNPVLYSDASGYVIELAEGATDEQRQQYERAIEYLKQSEKGRELIKKLEDAEEVITIVFVDNDQMMYEPYNRTIYFDSNSGLVMSDGISVQSAALGLAHEMGHAAQDLDKIISWYNMVFRDNARKKLEENNLAAYETPIAMQLGEPTRSDYLDCSGVRNMRNSTHFMPAFTRQWMSLLLQQRNNTIAKW